MRGQVSLASRESSGREDVVAKWTDVSSSYFTCRVAAEEMVLLESAVILCFVEESARGPLCLDEDYPHLEVLQEFHLV